MSCEKEHQEYTDAVNAHTAAVQKLKQQEGALFGGTSPQPIFLSDQDWDTMQRLDAEEKEAGRLEHEKSLAYDQAKRNHREQ